MNIKATIGNSIKNDCNQIVKNFLLAEQNNCKIILPSDVTSRKKHEGQCTNKDLSQILNNDIILDIGPKTIIQFFQF